jgi:RNA polymerase sigma-70 factor (ECF subfamily)
MKDEVEAEDVLQEAYLRAFSNLSSFRGDSSLATWLARITLNEALGRKRKEKPMLPLQTVEFENQTGAQIINFPTMANENDPEQLVARLEIRKLLENAIDTLPEMFRLVFIMREVEDMSVDETAELLNTRPQTVKTRLHRARRLLRASLDDRLSSTLKETFPFAGARCARITARVLERLSMGG